MFPLPKGAIEPAHVVLQAGIGEQDYFWFQEKYPGVAVMKHYASHFSTWRLCRGWDEAWSTYADTSRADHTFVHQLVRHWTSPSNDTEVTVAIKYDSPGIARRDLPASDRQYVAVIRHKVPDAQKFLAELGVKCNKSHTAK